MELERRPYHHKTYVKVRADFDFDGKIIPIKFRTEDSEAITIDKIMDIRQAAALKSGGQGTRYTCRVGDQMLYLFHDRLSWFVELC